MTLYPKDAVEKCREFDKRLTTDMEKAGLAGAGQTTYGSIAGGRMRPVIVEEEPAGSPFHPDATMGMDAYEKKFEATSPMPGSAESYRPPSMADEGYKRAHYHADIANKALDAADFFRKHHEFEEFIRLIRSGAIQI